MWDTYLCPTRDHEYPLSVPQKIQKLATVRCDPALAAVIVAPPPAVITRAPTIAVPAVKVIALASTVEAPAT